MPKQTTLFSDVEQSRAFNALQPNGKNEPNAQYTLRESRPTVIIQSAVVADRRYD